MSADEDRTPEEIQAEIDRTREDLGDTVASVADKADVKKQTKKKVKKKTEEVKAQVAEIRDAASDKVSDAKEDTGAISGSGGDIGSGPTGDVRQSPEFAGGGLADNPLVLVAAAFLAGLAIGRFTAR